MSEKKKRSGRFWIPNWVADGMLSSMKGGELRTLIALARFAGKDGLAWPAVSTLADMTGLEVRTVRRHLRRLESPLGLISKVSGGRGGRGMTTKYRLMAQSWMNLVGGFSSPDESAIIRRTQASGFTEEDTPETRTQASGFKSENEDTERPEGGHQESERGTPASAEGSEKEVLKVYKLEELDRIGNGNGKGKEALKGRLSAGEQEQRRQKILEDLRLHQESQPATVAG